MNFIPYEKLSKKEKRTKNKRERGDWGNVSPITRIVPNKKAYNRKRMPVVAY